MYPVRLPYVFVVMMMRIEAEKLSGIDTET